MAYKIIFCDKLAAELKLTPDELQEKIKQRQIKVLVTGQIIFIKEENYAKYKASAESVKV